MTRSKTHKHRLLLRGPAKGLSLLGKRNVQENRSRESFQIIVVTPSLKLMSRDIVNTIHLYLCTIQETGKENTQTYQIEVVILI